MSSHVLSVCLLHMHMHMQACCMPPPHAHRSQASRCIARLARLHASGRRCVRTYALEHMDAPAFRELTHYALTMPWTTTACWRSSNNDRDLTLVLAAQPLNHPSSLGVLAPRSVLHATKGGRAPRAQASIHPLLRLELIKTVCAMCCGQNNVFTVWWTLNLQLECAIDKTIISGETKGPPKKKAYCSGSLQIDFLEVHGIREMPYCPINNR
jgi:hypothetical protein